MMRKLWLERRNDPITVEMLIRAFFDRRDVWVLKRGYSVPTFVGQVPSLIVWLQMRRRVAKGTKAVEAKYDGLMQGADDTGDEDL